MLSPQCNEGADQWQTRPDLFVSYQPGPSAHWLLTHHARQHQYKLSQAQYEMLKMVDTLPVSDPLHSHELERLQAFILKLVQIGCVEKKPFIQNVTLAEPLMWDDPMQLAHWSLLTSLCAKRWPTIRANVDDVLKEAGCCYVCIKREGQVRGCLGSTTPRLPRLADEIVQNAMAAAYWDQRFSAVDAEEMHEIDLSIDIIETREVVTWPYEWDTSVYGMQVRSDQGILSTLLPGLEGINNAAQQLRVALRKTHISSQENITVERFTTQRLPSPGAQLPLHPYRAALLTDWDLLEELNN